VDRVAAFISYSFASVPGYVGLLDMFERQGLAVANRSVPAWSPLDATGPELESALENRIRAASRVIVLVTDDLHKSPCVRFEIDTARKHRKPIIAVYPNGRFGQPMPRALGDGLYRAIGWRGNALEKAILGDYPPDSRVFEFAEDVDRRSVVHWTLGASAGAALLIAGATHDRVEQLRRELQVSGVSVPPLERGPFVTPWMIGGAVTGLLVDALLGGKGWSLVAGALAGGAMGAGTGLIHHAHAELRQLGPLLELRRAQQNILPSG
jgi:hypothetical protein